MKDKNSDNNQGSNYPPERTDFFRVIIDLDFRILNFNDCFCYLSGYSREDLFSKNLLELMAEKNIKQVTGPPITLDHLIKTDKPVKYLDVFSTDGGEQTYQINLIPISGKISEIEKVCIIFKEFSDKDHHFEEKVLFNLFFKNSLVPQVILDNTLKITDMNDAFCQMVRYSYDSLINMDFKFFKDKKMLEYVMDEEKNLFDAIIDKKMVKSRTGWRMDHEIQIVNRNIIPFYDENGILKYVSIFYDESNLAGPPDTIRNGMFISDETTPQIVVDMNYTALEINEAFFQLFGYPHDWILSSDYHNYVKNGLLQYFFDDKNSFSDAIRLKEPISSEVIWISSNGKHIAIRKIIPCVDQNEGVIKLYVTYSKKTDEEKLDRDRRDVSIL